MPLKLRDVVTALAAAGLIASDKKPADVEAALRALDASMPPEEKKITDKKARDEKRAADRKARDEKVAKDRKARDEAAFEKKTADRKARDEKCAADRKARDKAMDEKDDPEGTNDAAYDAEMDKEAKDESEAEKKGEDAEMPGDPSTPGGNRGGSNSNPAIDSGEVDKRIAAAVAKDRALTTARADVAPVIGVVALDSAAAVYRAGLKGLGVDAATVTDEAALQSMFKMAKDRATTPSAPVVMDSAAMSSMEQIIPGYGRLK